MKYRVIQWATGGMGKNCLRALIDHPAMELVGVYVYGRDKAGKDAGEIARRPLTGVVATREVGEILALDADVVIHAARLAPPYGAHDADLIRLLQSGKNVISINGYSHPQHWGGQRFAALEAACLRGGTTLLGAGLNPGFAAEQLAIVASGVCTAIDHVQCKRRGALSRAVGRAGHHNAIQLSHRVERFRQRLARGRPARWRQHHIVPINHERTQQRTAQQLRERNTHRNFVEIQTDSFFTWQQVGAISQSHAGH